MLSSWLDHLFGPPEQISAEKLLEQREYHRSQYPPLAPEAIVIEIDERRTIHRPDLMGRNGLLVKQKPMTAGCSAVQFPPVNRGRELSNTLPNGLRSRYVWNRIANSSVNGDLARLLGGSFVPGEQVVLNLELKEGRIRDPMGAPENEALLKSLQEFAREAGMGGCGTPLPDLVFAEMDEETIQTWLYWMRRLLTPTIHPNGSEYHYATEIQNCHRLPTVEEVCASGLVRLQRDHEASLYICPEAHYNPDASVPVQRTLRDRDVPLIESLLQRD